MADTIDFPKQESELPFGILNACDAICIGGCLGRNKASDVAVEAILVGLKLLIDRGGGNQSGWMGEDRIEVVDWVIIGYNSGQIDREWVLENVLT